MDEEVSRQAGLRRKAAALHRAEKFAEAIPILDELLSSLEGMSAADLGRCVRLRALCRLSLGDIEGSKQDFLELEELDQIYGRDLILGREQSDLPGPGPESMRILEREEELTRTDLTDAQRARLYLAQAEALGQRRGEYDWAREVEAYNSLLRLKDIPADLRHQGYLYRGITLERQGFGYGSFRYFAGEWLYGTGFEDFLRVLTLPDVAFGLRRHALRQLLEIVEGHIPNFAFAKPLEFPLVVLKYRRLSDAFKGTVLFEQALIVGRVNVADEVEPQNGLDAYIQRHHLIFRDSVGRAVPPGWNMRVTGGGYPMASESGRNLLEEIDLYTTAISTLGENNCFSSAALCNRGMARMALGGVGNIENAKEDFAEAISLTDTRNPLREVAELKLNEATAHRN